MVAYKLYCLGDDGHIVNRHDIEAADDVAALGRAKAMCAEYEIEIWEGARFFTRVNKDGTTSKSPDPDRAREDRSGDNVTR